LWLGVAPPFRGRLLVQIARGIQLNYLRGTSLVEAATRKVPKVRNLLHF
jgi:hypothetical protein